MYTYFVLSRRGASHNGCNYVCCCLSLCSRALCSEQLPYASSHLHPRPVDS